MLDRVVVFGASGQLGKSACRILGKSAIPASRSEADFARPEQVLSFLDQTRPQAVFNAAAYTAVDLAEKETEQARLANAETPARVANWCRDHGVPLVHFSTDYVFPGTGTRPWVETDATEPLNVYGRTKREGELSVGASGADALIFRTSWVYDSQGKNFLLTMLRLGHEREQLRIVADQVGAPTFAEDLAQTSIECLEKAVGMGGFPKGIYHLCGTGETSWHGFAQKIFEGARKRGALLKVREVVAISSQEFPTPARRPQNSRLDQSKLKATFGLEMPSWESSLERCLDQVFRKKEA